MIYKAHQPLCWTLLSAPINPVGEQTHGLGGSCQLMGNGGACCTIIQGHKTKRNDRSLFKIYVLFIIDLFINFYSLIYCTKLS